MPSTTSYILSPPRINFQRLLLFFISHGWKMLIWKHCSKTMRQMFKSTFSHDYFEILTCRNHSQEKMDCTPNSKTPIIHFQQYFNITEGSLKLKRKGNSVGGTVTNILFWWFICSIIFELHSDFSPDCHCLLAFHCLLMHHFPKPSVWKLE